MLWKVLPYYLRMRNWMQNPLGKEEGQGLVEYALILVLVALVVIAALILVGGRINTVFGTISGQLDQVAATPTKPAG